MNGGRIGGAKSRLDDGEAGPRQRQGRGLRRLEKPAALRRAQPQPARGRLRRLVERPTAGGCPSTRIRRGRGGEAGQQIHELSRRCSANCLPASPPRPRGQEFRVKDILRSSDARDESAKPSASRLRLRAAQGRCFSRRRRPASVLVAAAQPGFAVVEMDLAAASGGRPRLLRSSPLFGEVVAQAFGEARRRAAAGRKRRRAVDAPWDCSDTPAPRARSESADS